MGFRSWRIYINQLLGSFVYVLKLFFYKFRVQNWFWGFFLYAFGVRVAMVSKRLQLQLQIVSGRQLLQEFIAFLHLKNKLFLKLRNLVDLRRFKNIPFIFFFHQVYYEKPLLREWVESVYKVDVGFVFREKNGVIEHHETVWRVFFWNLMHFYPFRLLMVIESGKVRIFAFFYRNDEFNEIILDGLF